MINPYALYGRPDIWPRGFPLSSINETNTYEFFNIRRPQSPIKPWIHQSLADLDPDVDAIYRLTQHKNIGKIQFRTYPESIAVGKGYFSPFNTQNTIYTEEAFWGLLIPFTTNFRVCDIWRGYWVQRLLWDLDGSLVFRPATVRQIRNAHDFKKDFEDELDLYLKTEELVDFLKEWKSDETDIFKRMLDIGQKMADKNFWHASEINTIAAWISDLQKLGYVPPKIQTSTRNFLNSSGKTAICISGQLNRLSDGFPLNQKALMNLFENLNKDYDIFYYLSTFGLKNESDLKFAIEKVNPTVGVIYDDPPLSPRTATNFTGLRPKWTPKNLFQQYYGLKRCYEIVEKYRMNKPNTAHSE